MIRSRRWMTIEIRLVNGDIGVEAECTTCRQRTSKLEAEALEPEVKALKLENILSTLGGGNLTESPVDRFYGSVYSTP